MSYVFSKDINKKSLQDRVDRLEYIVKYICWFKSVSVPSEEEFINMEKNYYKLTGEKNVNRKN